MTSSPSDVRWAARGARRARGVRLSSAAWLVGLLVAGCEPATQDRPQAAASDQATSAAVARTDTLSATIDSVNYMHERAVHYTLYDLSTTPPTAIGGSIVDRLATGGDKGCCVALPKTWRPGMKVRLDWHESDHDNIYEEHTSDLEIPGYDQPADPYVVFYPKNEVEIVVSPGEPGSANWRGRIKQTPWDQCVATYGRKPCKIALPKQFDTASSQGFCTYTKSKDFPKENYDGDNLCAFSMQQCMDDYEDEPFCKGILWGARRE